MPELEIATKTHLGVPVITLVGDMDSYAAPRARIVFTELVRSSLKGFLVNLNGVQYMDSAGLAILVEAYRTLVENGRSMALIAPSQPSHRVLQVTGLDRVFPTFGTEEEGLAALADL